MDKWLKSPQNLLKARKKQLLLNNIHFYINVNICTTTVNTEGQLHTVMQKYLHLSAGLLLTLCYWYFY